MVRIETKKKAVMILFGFRPLVTETYLRFKLGRTHSLESGRGSFYVAFVLNQHSIILRNMGMAV